MPITVNSQRPNGYVVLNTNATTFLGRPGDGGAAEIYPNAKFRKGTLGILKIGQMILVMI